MAKLVVQQSKNPTLQLQENVKADNIEEVRILLRNPPSTQLEWWELLKLSGSAEMEDILITALKSLDSMKRLVFNVDIKNSCESEESDSPFPPLIALHLLEDCEDLDPAHYTEYQGSTFLEAAAKKSIQLLTVMISMLKLRSSEEQRRCYEVKNSVGENILGLIVKDAKEKHFDVIRSIITDIPELIGLKSKGWTPLTPMHIAVNGALDAASRGTLDIRLLNLLIQKYPKALRVHTKDGNSPYSQVKVYKLEKWMHRDAEQIIEDIRSFLESRIFSAFSDNISDLRAALYGAKDPDRELALDLSDFDLPTHNFSNFTKALGESEDNQLKFESSLIYLQLPNFNKSPGETFHADLARLFTWLKTAGVKRICDLRVPDSFSHPVSDEDIERLLGKQFNVWGFDWRKLDLDIEVVRTAAEDVEKLHLYSSGNWPVLFCWATCGTCQKLTKLQKLTITIVEMDGVRSGDRLEQTKTKFITLWKECELNSGLTPLVDIQNIGMLRFNANIKKPRENQANFEITNELRLSHKFLQSIAGIQAGAASQKHPPVKVAIIDNGVDRILSTLSERIKKGQSFVENNRAGERRESPWWIAADPHGTQMASTVLEVNPCCDLYIGKAGRFRRDISLQSAVEAIQWAIDNEVQIISLSWVTEKDDPDLRKIIKDASDQNIAVFCSRGDQGNLSSPKYPADFPGTITVSATDRKNVRRKHSEEKADFFVVGEDILADGPSYYLGDGAEHLDHLCSGSSVATAVAAGLASLIVAYATCCQETGSKCIVTQRDIMVSLMKRCMCPPTPDGKSGYIDVRAFGPPLNERPNMDAHRRFAATLRAY